MVTKSRLKRAFARLTYLPLAGASIHFSFRLFIALREIIRFTSSLTSWLLGSREHTNFTYDIDAVSRAYLAGTVAVVTRTSKADIDGYFSELENDLELHRALRQRAVEVGARFGVDKVPKYGRRLAWYALTRASKPELIVETGVDKGLGAMVLAAALLRNAQGGHKGRLVAVDSNPRSGCLVEAPFSEFIDLRIGDSLEVIDSLRDEMVDLFIHDSDHRYLHETAELERILPRLSPFGFLVSDAATESTALADFAARNGLNFLFAPEYPINHWSRGQGLGVARRGP